MQTEDQDFLLWGHSLEEYRRMFDLTDQDLDKRILDCASGYATFNAQMHQKGKKVISLDKAYDLPLKALEKHMNLGLQNMLQLVEKNKNQFIWKKNQSISDLENENKTMIENFLKDFTHAKSTGRYVAGVLPELSFKDNQFNLTLCAYFLFMTPHSLQFHINAIKEMCRVGGECRIYPLMNDKGEPSELLAPIVLILQQNNFGIEIKQISYEFQKGANAMLRVWSQACEV